MAQYFSDSELAYLRSQPLARIATASLDGAPDVAPVGYRFDGQRFSVMGFDLPSTNKYKNVVAGNARVSLVVDDLASVQPWVPRGIKISGTCAIDTLGPRPLMVITPHIHWSWGIEAAAYEAGKPTRRRVVHEGG